MKKNIAIYLMLFLVPLLNFSQSKFAVLGGLNNSFLSNGFLKNPPIDKTFGIHFGALYEINLNEKIAFRPKLVFSQQGDRKKGPGASLSINDNSLDYKLSYINIPLNFKFFSKPYIIIGPQFGYLLDVKKTDNDFGNIDKKIDSGLNLGFGYEINKIFIEFNMYQGFTKILEFEPPLNSNNYNHGVTNSLLQISLGYYFK
ncbi:porin family protein [Flavobacterium flavipallidum]|uniref:Porin family protein n=1 Tax=Flavobacterium flavipallidum TaxID=3139140 RepID=A0ABU9HHF1_9FLAO